MKQIKVSEATPTQLDWLVAFAIGWHGTPKRPAYSTNWAIGGPIIYREGISWHCANKSSWHAYAYGSADNFNGPTPLIAAMRCFVASKLGDEVEVPDEL
jgi:hypothetical protein